jgi:adenylate cyclase
MADRGGVADPAGLLRWLQAAMGVFESAASSPDFLPKAAQAVADMVGLNSAAVLRWDNGRWRLEALRAASGAKIPEAWRPSNTILERVRCEKRTFRRVPQQCLEAGVSLVGVEALVASPILDAEGRVVGAIYGDRRSSAGMEGAPEITELEAMLVELLAFGVAAGLARLQQEQAALKARVQFEQFFTPELARQLESEPDLLAGKDAEISALFCDIRGFSRISERLGPARTVAWISDVMGVLSDCVIRHDGVLVDYIGDEIFAMWGAPVEQPDHEILACRAALDMIQRLSLLNDRWRDELGEPMGIGIGINSGVARVGNMGSQRKFKYGPLGNTVNLASRVQGATKYAKSDVLVTGGTASKLGSEFATRRLCRVRVVNIASPVDLYELTRTEDERWSELKRRYEASLRAYENQDLLTATKILGNLLADYPHDGPTQLLLSRAVNAMVHSDEEFDSVWTLSAK